MATSTMNSTIKRTTVTATVNQFGATQLLTTDGLNIVAVYVNNAVNYVCQAYSYNGKGVNSVRVSQLVSGDLVTNVELTFTVLYV